MLFDKAHIIYMLTSLVVTVGLLLCCKFFIKKDKYKDLVLKIAAILTVVIHFSSLYVDYFSTGKAEIASTMLLPIYPCNIAMWMLVVCAFCKNKKAKWFSYFAEFTFYLGVVGGIIGIAFNEIYMGNPTLASWGVLKGLLSHSVMLFGCIYLLVGGYIKIRVKNVISVALGLIFMILDGAIIIGLFMLCKLDPPNAMYLLEKPFPQFGWINSLTIGIFALLLTFAITAIYEAVKLPKEERWYNKLKALKKNKGDK